MRYRRANICGGTYFFTLVTFNRQQILCKEDNLFALINAFRYVKKKHPFALDAFVVLPDHMHCVVTLPDGDSNYPTRIRLFKSHFTRHCVHNKGIESASRKAKNERTVWQRRYWEHLIKNDEDFRRHVEYIHYNPVKHGAVKSPKEWKYSSFNSYVKRGLYDAEWGNTVIDFTQGVGSE